MLDSRTTRSRSGHRTEITLTDACVDSLRLLLEDTHTRKAKLRVALTAEASSLAGFRSRFVCPRSTRGMGDC